MLLSYEDYSVAVLEAGACKIPFVFGRSISFDYPCCIAVSGAKFVSPVDAVMIFFIAEFSNIALTSLCMWFDTKSPTFNFMGDGELVSANKNVAIALALGLVFAVLYGLFTMIGGFLPTFAGIPIKHGAKSIMGLLLIVSGVAAALGLVLLFVKLNKRYNKLYQ